MRMFAKPRSTVLDLIASQRKRIAELQRENAALRCSNEMLQGKVSAGIDERNRLWVEIARRDGAYDRKVDNGRA